MGQRALLATILTAAAVFSIAGCNDEQHLQGTTAGFQKCYDSASKQGLQDKGIKIHCSAKNEKSIDISLNGGASYDNCFGNDEVCAFYGTVSNLTTDYVVTGFYVIVTKIGGEISASKDFKNLWIEPGGEYKFSIPSSEMTYKPKGEERDMKYFNWNIGAIRGIKILTQ